MAHGHSVPLSASIPMWPLCTVRVSVCPVLTGPCHRIWGPETGGNLTRRPLTNCICRDPVSKADRISRVCVGMDLRSSSFQMRTPGTREGRWLVPELVRSGIRAQTQASVPGPPTLSARTQHHSRQEGSKVGLPSHFNCAPTPGEGAWGGCEIAPRGSDPVADGGGESQDLPCV